MASCHLYPWYPPSLHSVWESWEEPRGSVTLNTAQATCCCGTKASFLLKRSPLSSQDKHRKLCLGKMEEAIRHKLGGVPFPEVAIPPSPWRRNSLSLTVKPSWKPYLAPAHLHPCQHFSSCASVNLWHRALSI